MSKTRKPLKIDLNIKLVVPTVEMCSCGNEPPHAFIVAGDLRSIPFGSKYWGRGLLKLEDVQIFGEFIVNELSAQLEGLDLPEKGPKNIDCKKFDANAGHEVLYEDKSS